MTAGVVAGLLLLAASCGGDDDDGGAAATTSAATGSAPTEPSTALASTAPSSVPTTQDGTDSNVPQRIVSLSPTATEMLFAIGAGDQVIAVDDQSNSPAETEAVRTDLSGFTPNVEAIAGYEPDLVVTSGPPDLTSQLESVGLEAWEGPAATTLDEAYAQIEQLGAITGHVAEAAELVASMESEIENIARSIPTSEVPLTLYHELDPTFFSADSTTFIGALYSRLGLRNIADAAEGDTGGYPQLSAEFIISADPDLIFLADTKCCGENLDTVAARPGWDGLKAVVNGNVVVMDDDIASRWGPRVVDYAQTVADAVTQALVPSGG
jgi:iron complex transport system substrate-binding protein